MGIDYKARSVVGIELERLKYELREIEATRYDTVTGQPYQIKDWQHGVTFNGKFYDLYDEYKEFVQALELFYDAPFHPINNDNTIHGFIGYAVPSGNDLHDITQAFIDAAPKLGEVRLHTYLYTDA